MQTTLFLTGKIFHEYNFDEQSQKPLTAIVHNLIFRRQRPEQMVAGCLKHNPCKQNDSQQPEYGDKTLQKATEF